MGSASSGPDSSVRTSRPEARTSASTRARLSWGAVGASSSTWRSTPNVVRSSRSVSLLVSLIVRSAVSASSGRFLSPCSAAAACTLIMEMLCPRTSCSSLAIRSRSSPARRLASSSLLRTASSACCLASSRYARRLRVTPPNAMAATTHPAIITNRLSSTCRTPPLSPIPMASSEAPPVAMAAVRCPRSAAEYRQTNSSTMIGPSTVAHG